MFMEKKEFSKKDLPELQKAIHDLDRIIEDYEHSDEPSELLLKEMKDLHRFYVRAYFKIKNTDKPQKKVQKKSVKAEPSKLGGLETQKKGGEGHADMRNV
jgi:hypothetical protein